MPFGCWWFLNNPSIVEEMTRERLEMLGTSFIPQHSDARVLEQVIYKWRNTRRTHAPILTNAYNLLAEDGRPRHARRYSATILLACFVVTSNVHRRWGTPNVMAAGSITAIEQRSIFGTKLRWSICGLLFFATTVNYVDRQVLGILKPVLQHDLGWTEADYGWVIFTFQLAYGLMMPFAGRAMDWLGTRIGYALAVAVWSSASMLHALASTPFQFAMCRFGLGLGEASNFPAAIKTVADWFPRRERALATGIFNSGSNVGAIVAPLAVPLWRRISAGACRSYSPAAWTSSG